MYDMANGTDEALPFPFDAGTFDDLLKPASGWHLGILQIAVFNNDGRQKDDRRATTDCVEIGRATHAGGDPYGVGTG